MKTKSYIMIISLFLMGIIGFFKYQTGFIRDFSFSFFLIILSFLLYKKIRLTPITYSLVCFSLILHNLAAFGFYATNPFGIPYDFITHFAGIFSITLVIANFLSFSFSKNKKFRSDDIIILVLILLAGLGVGSIVENMEFTGYLFFGEGEGFFAFGPGDYVDLAGVDKLTLIVGGGYFDAMEDLLVNLLGAFVAVLVYYFNFFIIKKELI
jgi:uncharacterized membrane protein YjdF